MRKRTSSILIGLAFTSALCMSNGVQSVRADSQPSIHQSQMLNNELKPANIDIDSPYLSGFLGNNLVNGYVSDRTTQLSVQDAVYSKLILTDSNNHIVKQITFPSNSSRVTFDVTGLLKAGETYQFKDINYNLQATFKVVAGEIGVPTLNRVTNQDTLVTGTAAPGATVHLMIAGLSFSTTASSTGDFSINIEKKYPVNTPISLYQELDGMRSDTVEYYVQLFTEFSVNKIKSNATSITGSGHPNAQLSVRIHDEDFSGIVDGNGNFNISLQGATFQVGTDVTITSISSEGTITKNVKIYPRDPIVGIIFVADNEVRGTADPGATIFITVGSEKYQTTADNNGNFRQSVNPNLVISGTIVTVSTSINSLESDQVTVVVS